QQQIVDPGVGIEVDFQSVAQVCRELSGEFRRTDECEVAGVNLDAVQFMIRGGGIGIERDFERRTESVDRRLNSVGIVVDNFGKTEICGGVGADRYLEDESAVSEEVAVIRDFRG